MSNSIIPDTNNVTVAVIAAALHLADLSGHKGIDDNLARFKQAYEAISAVVTGAGEITP